MDYPSPPMRILANEMQLRHGFWKCWREKKKVFYRVLSISPPMWRYTTQCESHFEVEMIELLEAGIKVPHQPCSREVSTLSSFVFGSYDSIFLKLQSGSNLHLRSLSTRVPNFKRSSGLKHISLSSSIFK